MIATFLPVSGLTWGTGDWPLSRSQSATKRSRRPMETALPRSLSDLPTVQGTWHWDSCGQTRPQTAGSRLFLRITSAAALKLPAAISRTNPGMSMRTGQPSTHGALRHCRHRVASRIACSSV